MAHLALSVERYIYNTPKAWIKPGVILTVHWKQAVQQEMDLKQKNNSWSLVKHPEGAKVID
jgi:hypothetical protein